MAEKNSWNSLSKKEKEEFGDKATYEAFLRALGTMKLESEEQRSMGVTPVPKPKPKKKGINIKDKVENIKQRRKPGFKHKKYKHNQKDRNALEGINIKEGGLVLKVTKRGPLYKGKKSGNKNS